MIVNHLEKLFVTSDAATIMKELEVIHPAAKLLVAASQQQEAEVNRILCRWVTLQILLSYSRDNYYKKQNSS